MPYCQYENPTGIYFTVGDETNVWIGKTNGSPIALRVTNWDDKNFKQKTTI